MYTQRVITCRGAEPWRNKLNGAVQGRAALHTVYSMGSDLASSLKLEQFADLFWLIGAVYVRWFKEGGGSFCRFIFVCFTFKKKITLKCYPVIVLNIIGGIKV